MKTVHLNHYKLIGINIKSQSPYKLVLRVFLMSQTKTTKFHSLGLLQNIFSMPVACGLERLNFGIERIFFYEVHATGEEYAYKIKSKKLTLGSIIEKEPALQINFNQDNTMQDLLGFNPGIIYDKKYFITYSCCYTNI